MPVHPDCPEPLKSALEQMEALVQSTKKSLPWAAPEVQDTHWANLQEQLAETIAEAIEKARQ